jgi:hypothetical protein
MKERRDCERREAVLPAEVCDAGTGEVVGLLADISTGGMMLRSESPLARGTRLRLRVQLPGSGVADDALAVEAAVRWCEPDLDPSVHLAGLEFRGVTPPGSAVVEEIRRRLGQGR